MMKQRGIYMRPEFSTVAATRGLSLLAILGALAGSAIASGPDNNVEWSGVSHLVTQDLRPLVPLRNDAVAVRFQSYKNDLTAANVRRTVGGSTTSHAASVVGQQGPYDIWEATIPGTAADELTYTVQLIDGSDTDYLGAKASRPHEWVVSDNAPGLAFGLNFATLMHAPVGSTPVPSGTVFRVWAPSRATAAVRGEFNAWGITALTKHGEHFTGFAPGAVAGQMYKYFFNNAVWNTDPNAARLNPTDNYNAIISDPLSYTWQNDTFEAPPRDELVVYQLHIGTFAGLNDPAGPTLNPSHYLDVANRADHLADLGINAVMVNPINEFPGDFSGGYNPITQFGWEWRLGTPDDLKFMIDELHARGIAVILDVVWNHFSPTDNFLWNYDGSQSYYDTPNVDTPWGAQADFDAKGVYDYFLDSVHHVLGEFRMDGYRVDAVMAMTDSGWTTQWAPGQSLLRDMNTLVNTRYADAITIAEIYIDNLWVTNQVPLGLGFDTQYHNEFKEAVRAATFGAAFGGVDMGRVANVMDGSGTGVQGSFVLNYFELHDDAWNSNGHERAVRSIDATAPYDDQFARGRTMLAHGLTILSRGIPAILQGTEWLEDNGWESSKIDWSHKSTYSDVLGFYQDLISLRTSEPALFADSSIRVSHLNEGADVMVMHRWELGAGIDDRIVIANYSNNDLSNYSVGLPTGGDWVEVLNSQAPVYGGSGPENPAPIAANGAAMHGFSQSASVSIPAMGLVVLAPQPAPPCPADMNGDGVLDNGDIGVFITFFLGGNLVADMNGDGVLDNGDIGTFITLFLAGC
ncbi:MAG: 1,4-alpha-glucan branching enzyme [Phycisphaerales bacterium]|jgi:1,4-alpha-glucan branching enzyme